MAERTQIGFQINKHPIAQSFYIDQTDGILLTKVGIFFSAAPTDPSFPVTLQIRPLDNGVPSSTTIIPGSTVVLSQATVKADVDQYLADPAPAPASVETIFEFTSPIYLNGETMYSLVLSTNSEDYKVWVAETYEFEAGTTERRVDKNPISGTLFNTSNSITFEPEQNVDLTFKLYRAKFLYDNATIQLKNGPVPDYNLRENALITEENSAVVKVYHTAHGLQTGDDVVISGATGFAGIPAGSLNGAHSIIEYDVYGYTFNCGTNATASTNGGGSEMYATKNILYSHFTPKVESLQPPNTGVFTYFKGTEAESLSKLGTPYAQPSAYDTVDADKTNFALNRQYLIASKKQEDDNLAGASSLNLQAKLVTFNTYIGPYVDLQRCSFTGIAYVLDNQNPDWVVEGDAVTSGGYNAPVVFVPETDPNNGSSAAKHISTVITLQELSKGLKFFIGANRPDGTFLDLYYRTSTEGSNIRQKSWTRLLPEVDLPTDNDPAVFKEYEYLAGGLGGDLDDFNQYQFKIVFRSQYQYRTPVIRDLRVIALVD